MPRSASGSYTASASSWNPAVTGSEIDPSDWNTLLADISSEISDSFSRSGKGAAKADLSMGGFRMRLVGASASAGDAMSRSASDLRYQPLDAQLTALAGLTQSASVGIYFKTTTSAGTFRSTSAGRALSGVSGVASKVPYYTSSSSASSTSAPAATRSLWRLVAAADKLPYFSGSSSAASTSFTAAARTLLAAASASAEASIIIPGITLAGKAVTKLAGVANKVPYFTSSSSASSASATAANRAIWRLTGAASQLPYYTSSSSAASTSFTSAGRAMLRASSASAQTALLAAFIGSTTSAAGIKGLVPAPGAGATNRFLRVDGTFAAVTSSAGGDVVGPASSVDNGIPRFSGTGGKTLKSSSATLSDTGRLSRVGGIHVQGTNTNDSTSAGYVGEHISKNVTSSSAISLTTATPATLAKISLTAGDWDVFGNVYYSAAAGTVVTQTLSGISSTSATIPTPSANSGYALWAGNSTSVAPCQSTGSYRQSLSGTTTIYLIAYGIFTTSTLTAFGTIQARRRR